MRSLPIILGLVVIGAMISAAAALTLLATQGMTGRESLGLLTLRYGGGWFLLFGGGAALPMLFSAPGRRSWHATFAFAVGGGVSGIIAILLLFKAPPTAGMMVFSIPFTLPWVVGAIVLAAMKPKMTG